MKIGVFGGSFDPIHTGHLVLAEYTASEAGLDKVVFLPAFESPFKIGKRTAGSEHRLEMVRLATRDNDRFEVSSYDMDQKKVSYTVDLLRDLSERYPSGHPLYFIAGTDSILEIERWRGSQELLTTYGFVVGARPGYRESDLEAHAAYLKKNYGTDIQVVPVPQVDISSTLVRRRRSEGKGIRYLVPHGVEEYIFANGLYETAAKQQER